MRDFISYFLLVAALLTVTSCGGGDTASGDTPSGSEAAIYVADPTIFFHQGKYYLYGTSRADEGFLVYTSSDGKSWEGPKGANEGFALREGDVFGDRGFWAPQVFFHNNRFYMAYTANENIAIAQSDSPLGPFSQEVKQPLKAPVKQIDPFVFMDDEGKAYLYHVRVADGGNRIFVAEMTADLTGIKPETLVECIRATSPWENSEHAPWSVTEGPSLLKHDGYYYLVYSANDFRSKDYAVGYAVADSPYGPWKKYSGNPILSRQDVGRPGTGHGDFFYDRDGALNYVLHTHHNDSTVGPRRTAVVKAGFFNGNGRDRLGMDESTFYYIKHKTDELP